jgi:hypothetical protein
MGTDLGLVSSASTLPSKILGDATRAAWGREATPAAVLVTVHRVRLLTSTPLEVALFSVAPRDAAPLLQLDRVARNVSKRLPTGVTAAFMADHYGLGGYQLFEAGRRVDSLLLEEGYVDGPRRALERLIAAPLELERNDRLFFAERWLWEQTEGEAHSFALALRGKWLSQPIRVTVSDAQWERFGAAYVLDYPSQPEVLRKLRDPSWRGAVRGWAAQQTIQGADVYLKEDGYRRFEPQATKPTRKTRLPRKGTL